jgi:uncharacterized membrane protein YqjE
MNWLGLFGLDKRIERCREVAREVSVAAEDRVSLLMLEWQEEKLRLRRVVVLGVLAATMAIVTLTVLSFAVMVQFWESGHREAAAWGVAAVWLLAWAAVVLALVRAAEGGGKAFALTRQELARDWSELKGRM